ncbi:MAG: M50 family metallopeptidase [Desulfarculus sp.]|nr:M50 family metallopeptidase [Desulfarculus sp.]
MAAEDDAVRLRLPPWESLLPLAEDALRRLSRQSELTPALEDMLVGAVLEACEELLRAGRSVNIEQPFELVLAFGEDAADVAIAYDGNIPLNPHLTEPYEVPSVSSDPDDINLDTLWLHLVKHRMDRVFFEVKGPLHRLRLIKYRREEGEEKRLWFLGMSPALRPGLNVEYSGPEDNPSAVLIQDFTSGKVFRFGPTEALFVGLMDGQRNLFDIYMHHVEKVGPVSPHRLGVLYETLEASGMLATAEEMAGQARQRPWVQKLLNPIFSIPRADEVVGAVHGWVKPLVSPLGVLLLVVLGLSGAIPLWQNYSRLVHVGLPDLERLILLHPSSLVAVYLLGMIMVAFHELAHGVACKHYGGRVPRMGMMLYLASFIFFCDTTSAWNFPRKSHRVMVSLAGPLVSFAFLGGALWAVGHYLGTGSFWEPVFILSCILFFFGLVMNFNPFIRMDAYYMLMDLTGIGNLREKSFRFLGRRLLGKWLPGREQEQDYDKRQRVIFWLYGVLGVLVTAVIFVFPFIKFARLLTEEDAFSGFLILGAIGIALALFSFSHKALSRLRAMRRRKYKIK